MTICFGINISQFNSFKKTFFDKLIQAPRTISLWRLMQIQIFLLITHLIYLDQASSRLVPLRQKKISPYHESVSK